MTYDVAVVGGGIVGAATAYSLARAGARTVLIDAAARGRGTDAAAGLLSPLTSIGSSEDAYQFSRSADRYFALLISQLVEAGFGDGGFRRRDLLVVAVDDDEIASFAALVSAVAAHPRDADSGAPRPREISPTEAGSLHPHLRTPKRALFVPDAAQVDGRALTAALLAAAEKHRLDYLGGTVAALSLEKDRIVAVHTQVDTTVADQYVFAGGAWTPQLTAQLGFLLPLAPQRGQLVHLRVARADFSDMPMVKGLRGHYLIPGAEGRVIAGATREVGGGFDSAATAGGVVQVLDEAVRLAPVLDQADLTEVRAGLRPTTPDGRPVVGRVPSAANLVLATGHGSHGLQLGPYTGHAIAAAILEGAELVPTSYSPARFCS